VHRGNLFPVEFGVVILIEQEELHDDAGCEARHTVARMPDEHLARGAPLQPVEVVKPSTSASSVQSSQSCWISVLSPGSLINDNGLMPMRARALQSLAGGPEYSSATAALGSGRNSSLQIRQRRSHFGIGRVGHTLAFDLDATKTRREQRVALRGHLFERHV
jgi:hypothetical protein